MDQLCFISIEKGEKTYNLAFEEFLCLFQELVRHIYSLQRMAESESPQAVNLGTLEETALAANSAALTPSERA